MVIIINKTINKWSLNPQKLFSIILPWDLWESFGCWYCMLLCTPISNFEIKHPCFALWWEIDFFIVPTGGITVFVLKNRRPFLLSFLYIHAIFNYNTWRLDMGLRATSSSHILYRQDMLVVVGYCPEVLRRIIW